MKKSNFKINVGDLLLSAGKNDSINFKNEFIEDLPNLSKEGVSGAASIQSFDQNSLFVTLKNLDCTLNEACDICSKEYNRDLEIAEYSAKFQTKTTQEEEGDDEIFKIDGNENIDIQDMVIQAIILQEPFAKACPKCKKTKPEETIDDLEYFEGTGNITFS